MTMLAKEFKGFVRFEKARTPTWFWDGTTSIEIDASLIGQLESFSDENATNCRLCFHENPSSTNHKMLIVERRGMNIPPHYHEDKCDFIFVLRGAVELFEFATDGKVLSNRSLSCGEGFQPAKGRVHAVGIKTDSATYIECSKGPFHPDCDAIFTSWAHAWHDTYCSASQERLL